MKNLLLLFSTILLTTTCRAQLEANAGMDTVKCGMISSGTYPRLGGVPAATGGTAPYTYKWELKGNAGITSQYLNDPTLERPQMTNFYFGEDSVEFVLKVTDAVSALAYDTVKVYNSRWTCILADCIKFKNQDDTVTIGGSCQSSFAPLSYEWTSPNYLSDTHAPSPRTWTPIDATYTVKLTDDKGCYMHNTCKVYVNKTGIDDIINVKHYVSINPNPVNETSVLSVSADMTGGELKLFAVDGKLLQKQTITQQRTSIVNISQVYKGLCFYVYEKQDNKPVSGKLIIE